MRRSLHPRRCCVSCRFCQNSFCHFYQPPCALEEKFFVDMDKESPGMRVKFWNSLLSEIMAKLMKMRGISRRRGEGVDVVFGAPALAISGLELQSFIFSEIFREMDWRDRFCLSVFDTTRPPQCEFSNLHTSLAFGLLE